MVHHTDLDNGEQQRLALLLKVSLNRARLKTLKCLPLPGAGVYTYITYEPCKNAMHIQSNEVIQEFCCYVHVSRPTGMPNHVIYYNINMSYIFLERFNFLGVI